MSSPDAQLSVGVLVSKVLGTCLIGLAFLVKFPQILKIIRSGSAEGLSLSAAVLELFAMTSSVCYNFAQGYPFTAWGDTFFVGMQNVAIVYLIFLFRGQMSEGTLFVAVYLLVLWFLAGSGLVPLWVLATYQMCNVPLILSGKMTQAATNVRNGHTGQLSLVTISILMLGSLARVFTTLKETGDTLVTVTYAISSFANCLLFLQVLYYWDATQRRINHSRSSSGSQNTKGL
ncbi:mannose-P-dolichol utilization defect 1 protein homolog [Symsagittifera roscoffensis]|uniref:mannose-P-dolichol utilization defect 1 protein homolog n=1 Tax=Symsagittifera roscoffensis TaxID=84072 RepID=UPI00307C228E